LFSSSPLFLSSSCLRFFAIFADWDCSIVVFVKQDCTAAVDRLVSASLGPPSASIDWSQLRSTRRLCHPARHLRHPDESLGSAAGSLSVSSSPVSPGSAATLPGIHSIGAATVFDRWRRVSILSTRSILSRLGSIFSWTGSAQRVLSAWLGMF
jgi:hypothetical protein